MFRKALLAILLILAGLYVAADLGAGALADAGVSKELQTSLRLSRRPDVSLGGFPFIPKLVSGHLDDVRVTARGFTSSGVRFDRVALTLRDVTFSTWRVLRGSDTSIGVGSGTGTASITGAEVTDAVRSAGLQVTVRLRDGHAVIAVPGGAGSVAVEASVHSGAVVFRSAGLPGSIRVPLPDVVPTIHYTGVSFSGDRAVLTFRISRTRLPISR